MTYFDPPDAPRDEPPAPTFTSDGPPPGNGNPEEDYPFWGWADVLLLAGLTVPVILLVSAIIAGAAFATQWAPRFRAVVPLSATFLFYGIYIVLMWLYFRLRYHRPLFSSLGWVASRPLRVHPFTWGIITALGAVAFGVALRTPDVKTPLDQLMADPVSIALMSLFAVTLAPIFEELLFRGLLFPLIARSLGAVAGAFLAALPFALLHGPEYAWTWQRVGVVFLAGAAFGWMRYRSGSTAAAALMHAGYNGTFVAMLALSKVAS